MKKNLKYILNNVKYSILLNNVNCDILPNFDINKIVIDSRLADSESVFVAIKGTQNDGHNFVQQVYDNGCRCIIVEKKIDIANIYQIIVKDSSDTLALVSSNFYDNPSNKITLVGITGTNGKTTTATLAFNCFNILGLKSGLLSTIVNKIADEEYPSTHTTPNPLELNKMLSLMLDKGCKYCFMEVSSHAIDQKRINHLDFDLGVFTNITHDHLDYHKTFDDYIKVKKSFFDNLSKNSFALTNIDDKNGLVMTQNTKAKTFIYSLKSSSDYKAKIIENNINGLELDINNQHINTMLTGVFNAYNILAVYSIADILGISQIEILKAISVQKPVKGRFQSYTSKSNITAIIDYAHTPDALENVLKTIQHIKQNSNKDSNIICVVGCGGDRDKAKRPEMAKISCYLSNQVVLTSDNPRSEDPFSILEDMKKGINEENMSNVIEIIDRFQAIKTACLLAKPNDIILIAGKGHETYQETKGVRVEFDDYKIVIDTLNKLNK